MKNSGMTSSVWIVLLMLFVWFDDDRNVVGTECDGCANLTDSEDKPHSRQKRLLWVTTDGRLALPPGTSLSITPSLSLPFVRFPPSGFKSEMSISMPFTINFDTLGLTDNQNPFGAFPSMSGRSMARQMGSSVADNFAQYFHGRSTRSLHSNIRGGERAVLYGVVEDMLNNFGMDGKACLLRVICEVHGHGAINTFGMIGEFLHLFLSASKSSYAHYIEEYVTAENVGKTNKECFPYYKGCPKSLFLNSHNYSENDVASDEDEEGDWNGGNGGDSKVKKSSSGGAKAMDKPSPLAM